MENYIIVRTFDGVGRMTIDLSGFGSNDAPEFSKNEAESIATCLNEDLCEWENRYEVTGSDAVYPYPDSYVPIDAHVWSNS